MKLLGGRLTADEYLAMDDIAGKYAKRHASHHHTAELPVPGHPQRQHEGDVAAINDTLVTTRGVRDVNRNVLTCPAPHPDPARKQMLEDCYAVASALAPKAGKQAYHEIWLNGEKVDTTKEVEPLYGETYLPRKFKTAFSLPDDNCTDILANCLGYLAITENGKHVGYNLYAGGGQGQTNSKPDTYPLLAQCLGFIEPSEVVAAAEGMVKLFATTATGRIAPRALKYVMKAGASKNSAKSSTATTSPPPPPREARRDHRPRPAPRLAGHGQRQVVPRPEWRTGHQGRGFHALRSGLRAIVSRFRAEVRLTTQQDVLVCGISTADRSAVDSMLAEYGIPRPDTLSMRRSGAWRARDPTCSLAITEAERLPGVVDQLERCWRTWGWGRANQRADDGCPNGCAAVPERGGHRRSRGRSTRSTSAATVCRRLNAEVQDSVPIEQIVPKLAKVFRLQPTQGDGCSATTARIG